MSRKVDLTDPENPEWTEADFARAKPAEAVLTLEQLAAFPKIAKRVRGPQRAPKKRLVSLRIDPDILDHYRATGRGWQSRINEDLRKVIG